MINNYIVFKSVYWTKSYPGWAGGWKSNYSAWSVADELDWTKHPALEGR